jgi:peptidoglycan/xylan/chitin deacetylase (PgdA/CDA1 family)
MVDGVKVALSAARAKPLVEAARGGIIEIALHGHTHQRRFPEPATPTEFAGRPENEQRSLIEEGRARLENIFGRRITGFVPPYNSYDHGTLTALESSDFRYFSAGTTQQDYRGTLKSIPLTAHLTDLPSLFDEARLYQNAYPVIVIVMHHYDFAESGSPNAVTDLPGFERALELIQADKSIHIATLDALASGLRTSVRQLMNHHHWAQSRILRTLVPKKCFLDAPLWHSVLSRLVHG